MGTPRFGPETVTCGHCGTTLNTGLKPWAKLNAAEKTSKTVSELIAPSYIGNYHQIAGLIWILFNVFCWVFILVGLVAIVVSLTGGFAYFADSLMNGVLLGVVLLVCGFVFGAAFPLRHLYREIKSSNEYTRKGLIPTWRVKKWLWFSR